MRYRCGVYLRLSREDGMDESNSIGSQRMLLQQYIEKRQDLIWCGEWVDDGWSGSSFERPAFQEMLSAVLQRTIDCILVKDLSRFGREYIQTGRYLQEIFPRLGVRVIAVSDGYDSMQAGFTDQSLLLPVLNLMNDAYCRDISQKVRWQQQTKRQAGEYIGAFAVYGYRKDPGNRHCLTVDGPAAEVVRAVYALRLNGYAPEQIADRLNVAGIASPRNYKKQSGSAFRCGFDSSREPAWSALAVRRILHNRMYTGVMEQGKSRKLSYKLEQRAYLPREEWICIKDCIPAILPAWFFERQQYWEQKKLRRRKGQNKIASWEGMGLNMGQKIPIPLQMDRLKITLLFDRLSVCEKEKTVKLWTAFRRGDFGEEDNRYLCKIIRVSSEQEG